MQMLGNFLGFIFNKIFMVLLGLLLTFGVSALIITNNLSDRNTIKTALNETDTYTTITANLLDLMTEPEQETEQPLVPSVNNQMQPDNFMQPDGLQQEAIKEFAQTKTFREALDQSSIISADELTATLQKVYDAEFLREQTEGVIDSVYDVIEGTSNELMININLQPKADELALELNEMVSRGFQSLPECSVENINTLTQEVDIFETACIPPGVSIDQEVQTAINELVYNDSVLSQQITEDDLGVSTLDLQVLQLSYQAAERLPFLLIVFIVGFAAAGIMTSKTIHRGFKLVGTSFITSGVLIIVLFMFFAQSYNPLAQVEAPGNATEQAQQEAMLAIMNPIYENIIQKIAASSMIYSIVFVSIGVVLFIIGSILRRHHVDHLTLHHKQEISEYSDSGQSELPPVNKPSELASTEKNDTSKNQKPPLIQ